MKLNRIFPRYLGVDLGTSNTLIHMMDEGIVVCEPSVVALDTSTNNIVAVGEEAKRMIGKKTPENIAAIRPLKDGVIANFEVTQEMLKHFINKAYSNKKKLLIKPSIVIGVPSGATDVEKRAVIDVAISAGAKEAILIEEPMAAAIGSGLPVHEAIGSLVVDIGGGTTEIAVLSLGGIVTSVSIRVGGDELDASIVSYIKKRV